MANFSVNQVRQFYVLDKYAATVDKASDAGTVGAVGKTAEGDEVFFFYKGADTVLKSDQIQIKNIGYAKAISAFDMATVLKVVEVTLDTDVNSGDPIPGQDYVLGINFKNFFSSGDASQYYKDVAVRATGSMTASDLYIKMVEALNKAFAREDGATADSNPYLTFAVDNDSTATKIIITEKPQDWTLGIKKARRIMFDVFPGTVSDTDGEEVIWGAVADATPAKYVVDAESQDDPQPLIPNEDIVVGTNAIGNGQQIADLEYFAAGERGDQYRMAGWPNYIHTDYLVDASKEYNVLEIHYAFTDTGVNSYRTEKEITIVAEDKSELNKFISAFNTAVSGSSDAPIAAL